MLGALAHLGDGIGNGLDGRIAGTDRGVQGLVTLSMTLDSLGGSLIFALLLWGWTSGVTSAPWAASPLRRWVT